MRSGRDLPAVVAERPFPEREAEVSAQTLQGRSSAATSQCVKLFRFETPEQGTIEDRHDAPQSDQAGRSCLLTQSRDTSTTRFVSR